MNDIGKSLTARFQQNEQQLATNAETISSLESENQALTETVQTLQNEISSLSQENSSLSDQISVLHKEITSLTAAESESTRERNKLEKLKRQLENEIQHLRVDQRNWERTANEEHEVAENARDRIVVLEEEIASYKDHRDSSQRQVETLQEENDNLRIALREGQEERKRELREVVEGMQSQIDRLTDRAERLEKKATDTEVRKEKS